MIVRGVDVIEVLIQVTGTKQGVRFAGGVVARDGRVIEAAPILRSDFPKGSPGRLVADVCRQNGWTWEKIHEIHS